MIISHSRRFIYYGPPKTASTSLHHWLSQPTLCIKRFDPDMEDPHQVQSSSFAKDYYVFASIRHPLDRCVSLWFHSQDQAAKQCGVPNMSFTNFVLDYQPTATYFYRDSQSTILHGVEINSYVHFENLEYDVMQLPPIKSLICRKVKLENIPHYNKVIHTSWKDIITPELESVIRERWGEDWNLCSDWE